jgi:hypothetical protein
MDIPPEERDRLFRGEHNVKVLHMAELFLKYLQTANLPIKIWGESSIYISFKDLRQYFKTCQKDATFKSHYDFLWPDITKTTSWLYWSQISAKWRELLADKRATLFGNVVFRFPYPKNITLPIPLTPPIEPTIPFENPD